MTKVTGSKNGNAIRAKFPVKEKQTKQIKDCSCLILVSIKNNKFCSGKWLAAIARSSISTFKSVTFLVVDELQRYNYILELEDSIYTEKELSDKTAVLLDEWWLENEAAFLLLFENQTYIYHKLKDALINKTVLDRIVEINKLAVEGGLNFHIVTWCNWLASCPSYFTEKAILKAQYESIDLLRKGLEESAEEFALRKSKSNPDLYPRAIKIAKEFLLEEAPGLMIVGARLGYSFVAYPGKMVKALETTYQYFVQKNFQNKMQWIDVDFEKFQNHTVQSKQQIIIKPVSKNPFLSEPFLTIAEEDIIEK